MKDRIVTLVAFLIFALMQHPQRRERMAAAPTRPSRFPRLRRLPVVS